MFGPFCVNLCKVEVVLIADTRFKYPSNDLCILFDLLHYIYLTNVKSMHVFLLM